MDLGAGQSHSFIIRIWVEETAAEGHPRWRGRITSIPDGNRHYFVDLVEIERHVAPYLAQMGMPVRRGLRSRLSAWVAKFL